MSTVPSLIPPLRDGDQLTREEFLRRWEAMPELKHAELIDGTVYVPSPVSYDHGSHHALLAGCAVLYAASTPGCEAADNVTWRLAAHDLPQPDIVIRVLPEYGGLSRLEGGYGAGPVELVMEVSQSSAARDLGPKLRLYQAAGVREYLTVLLHDRKVIWRQLMHETYEILARDEDGLVRSRVFPGLWLDPEALLSSNGRRLIATVQKGLQSAEHAEFVQQLERREK